MPEDIVTALRGRKDRLSRDAADHVERWQEVAWQLAELLLDTVGQEDDWEPSKEWMAQRRDSLAAYWVMCGITEGDLS